MSGAQPGTRSTGPARAPGEERIVLLFPGQGAQHAGMGVGLYSGSARFRAHIDEVFGHWGKWGENIRRVWLEEPEGADIHDAAYSQPLLFAIDYSLARLVLERGVRPYALLGHSVGEIAAAAIAGIFTLAQAAKIIRYRGDRLENAPAGGMLAVSATVETARYHMAEEVWVAAINSPRQTVLAGTDAGLEQTRQTLDQVGIVSRRTRSDRPFHSPLLKELTEETVPWFNRLSPSTPRIPIYSAYTQRLLGASKASDGNYWASHPAEPVLFSPTVSRIASQGPATFIESGPGRSLTAAVLRNPAVVHGGSQAIALLPAKRGAAVEDLKSVNTAVHRLRAAGALATFQGEESWDEE